MPDILFKGVSPATFDAIMHTFARGLVGIKQVRILRNKSDTRQRATTAPAPAATPPARVRPQNRGLSPDRFLKGKRVGPVIDFVMREHAGKQAITPAMIVVSIKEKRPELLDKVGDPYNMLRSTMGRLRDWGWVTNVNGQRGVYNFGDLS